MIHPHSLSVTSFVKFTSIEFILCYPDPGISRIKSCMKLIDLSNFCNPLNNSNNTNGSACKVRAIIMEIAVLRDYDEHTSLLLFYRSAQNHRICLRPLVFPGY